MIRRRIVGPATAFLRASRREGIGSAVRKAARRARNRLARPLLEEQAGMRAELERLRGLLVGVGQTVETHGRWLDDLGRAAQGHARRLDGLEQTAGSIGGHVRGLWLATEGNGARFERIDQALQGLGQRVGQLAEAEEARAERLGDRWLAVEEHARQLEGLRRSFEAIDHRIVALDRGGESLGERVDALAPRVEAIGSRVEAIGSRVEAIGRDDEAGARRLDELERDVEGFRRSSGQLLKLHSESIAALAEYKLDAAAVAVDRDAIEEDEAPRISVVMAAYNREHLIAGAIESVLAQTWPDWELLIVDDGSTDGTRAVVERYRSDPRIRLLAQEHLGAASARNRGLAESRGELIAYLDSDNVWFPGTLAAIEAAFADDPRCDAVHFAQIRRDHGTGEAWVDAATYDRASMFLGNAIDLNTFAHRRRLFARHGGFDTNLTRLIDWDLILRYTADAPPKRLPVIGGRYEMGNGDRVTLRENYGRNRYLVQNKHERPVASPPRVLYALWHYPQLSETYITTEIERMQRWGVHVEAWSEIVPASPFPSTVPIHSGTLAEAIDRVRPDLVHTHWIHMVAKYREAIERAGLLVTVRGHSFDFTEATTVALEGDPVVRALYMFPHLAASCPGGLTKVVPTPACFNPERFRPGTSKDPRLVLRAGSGLPSKDYQTFIRVAKECPGFRFVLALVRCNGMESFSEEMIEYNRSLGGPVDIRVNVMPRAMARLTREAGIYLHTHAPTSTFGMPVSICESWATGGHAIARRCAGSEAYLGDPALCYDDEEQAIRLIRETAGWSRERWHQVQIRAIDEAYGKYLDSIVLGPILHEWQRIVAEAASLRAPRKSA